MLQRQIFPLISTLPSPSQRIQEREQGGPCFTLVSLLMYFLFSFMPGTITGLGVAVGRVYGISVYEFFVSWLFFWIMGVLILDPFIARYRSQLADLIHHWNRVMECTRTCLAISFDHGLPYFAMLWSVSYAFVFMEAAMRLFWDFDLAVNLTTFVFGCLMIMYLVVWLGRVVRRHSQLVFSNQPAPPPSASEVEVKIDNIQVRLTTTTICTNPNTTANGMNPTNTGASIASNGMNRIPVCEMKNNSSSILNPSIRLNDDNHWDLTKHLQENQQQVTIAGNVMTMEPISHVYHSNYRCYRVLVWSLLAVLALIVFMIVLLDSFDWIILDTWQEYGALFAVVLGMLSVIYGYGRKFSDPTYLQFFLLSSTFFPIVYGSWLLSIQSTYAWDATYIIMLHLALSNLYLEVMAVIIRHFSAPFLYARFMMLPQTMIYLFELVIFGFTPWSIQYVLVLLVSSTHNVLTSTGLYHDWFKAARHCCCGHSAVSIRNEEDELFVQLLTTRHSMQLFAQDTIADVWSMVVVLTALGTASLFGVPPNELMPSFTLEPIFLRVAALLIARLLTWFASQLIFRQKMRASSLSLATTPRVNPSPNASVQHPTLSARLDRYLDTFGLSRYETAELRSCYEEDMPELFAHEEARHLTMTELIALQVTERQWLLHPALLRKHFMYFHAQMYLLLFIVLQAASHSLPLRYAWYKPLIISS